MMLSGQLAVESGEPFWSSTLTISFSATEPGTWTEPGTSAYWNVPRFGSVTFTFDVAPFSNETEQLNVAPFFDSTPLGQSTFDTGAPATVTCSLIPFSTAASSTVFVPQPLASSATRSAPTVAALRISRCPVQRCLEDGSAEWRKALDDLVRRDLADDHEQRRGPRLEQLAQVLDELRVESAGADGAVAGAGDRHDRTGVDNQVGGEPSSLFGSRCGRFGGVGAPRAAAAAVSASG